MADIGNLAELIKKPGAKIGKKTKKTVSANATKAVTNAVVDGIKGDLSETKSIMYLGFLILLFMLGTLIWTAFTDWRHTIDDATKQVKDDRYNLIQQKYDFQQKEIEYLQNLSTTSGKIGQ